MIPFHSETQRAMENLQKFWAKGDVTFFKQSVILERSMKAFENEKNFSALNERIRGFLRYSETGMENYYSKWNLIWQKQHKKIVLTIFITAIKVSKIRTFFMTNIFNDKQIKASASEILELISIRMTPHLNILCGILNYSSIQDQNLWDVWSAYIYSNQQLKRFLHYK